MTCTSDPASVDCDCEGHNQSLSTTGFGAGGNPTEIASCCSEPLNGTARVTHPAVAGPQRPDGSWLLFYMRGKKIWYTKIAE